jgi:hypothetical protein
LQNNNITAQVIGLALGLILAIGLVGIPTALAADPDYTKLDSATAEQTNGKMKLMITAAGNIPKKPDDYINSVSVFGFGWLKNGKGVVAAIHPALMIPLKILSRGTGTQ